MITIQWNRDHGRRSSRPGMSVSIRPVSTVAALALALVMLLLLLRGTARKRRSRHYGYAVIACRVLGHRHRFRADGATMTWACERCGGGGGSKTYATAEEASLYARGFDREDREDLGRRAPLVAGFPLRIARVLRERRAKRGA
jgi:hypothetical protein